MLTFKITEDKLHLQLVNHTLKGELRDLQGFFKKRQKGYLFNQMYKRKLWDGFDKFIDKENRLGVGLWREVFNFAEKYGYDVNIEGIDQLINQEIDRDLLVKFASVLLDGTKPLIEPRDYQLEAAFRALKYKFCSLELATSAGKTLIFFIYLSWLKRKGVISKTKKALIVVPRAGLVSQTAEKFLNDYATGLVSFNILQIGGKHKFTQKKFDESDLVISTYQSLGNMDSTIFSNFSVIGIDECHTTRGTTVKDILLAANQVEYKVGLSGTINIEENYSDFFKIQEYLGPLSMTLKSSFLIENGYSPDVYIKIIYLEYPQSEPFVREYMQLKELGQSWPGVDMFDAEKSFIIGYEPRIKFISEFTRKLPGNTLVLFINVKDKYGQRICSEIETWNEHVYYIDGGVDDQNRDDYKLIMEKQTGVVLVASYGTFSTGIDLKNVNQIIFAESYKSEVTIRQSIGRGMRNLTGKIKVTIYDLVDNLNGYIIAHGQVREKIYKKEKFPITKHTFNLEKYALN